MYQGNGGKAASRKQTEAQGWKLVWADEFDYRGLPDPKKWDYEQGLIRNNELQFYTKGRAENARVENGALVIEIQPGPAADAGLEVDDIITEIDGDVINEDSTLTDLLFEYEPGDTVELTVYRPATDETLTIDVTLGTRPSGL